MIPKIKNIHTEIPFLLLVQFDDGKEVRYDMQEDIDTLPGYGELKEIAGLFDYVQVDHSRTCIFWNDHIDLPSDILYQYGKPVNE